MRWLLPEGVEEVLPPHGWALEDLRRRLLDLFRGWGYEIILPPLIEHLDALLSGVGSDLDLQTFRLTDQLSGRQLGLRADITPQAARVDARHMAAAGIARLCYLGTVVRTRPAAPGGARCLRQVGAELFGHDGVASDLEIVSLMLAMLRLCGIARPHLDLGHIGVYRSLARRIGLGGADEACVFELLQHKADAELRGWTQAQGLAPDLTGALLALADLHGGPDVLVRARRALLPVVPEAEAPLVELEALIARLQAREAQLCIHVDLSELQGYRYQTGVVFAAFVAGRGRELARGGRYNGVGAGFGADRPATGFSADLNELLGAPETSAQCHSVVAAPDVDDADLHNQIERLRAAGTRVIVALDGVRSDQAALIKTDTGWVVQPAME